jgi:hypothetical protein
MSLNTKLLILFNKLLIILTILNIAYSQIYINLIESLDKNTNNDQNINKTEVNLFLKNNFFFSE